MVFTRDAKETENFIKNEEIKIIRGLINELDHIGDKDEIIYVHKWQQISIIVMGIISLANIITSIVLLSINLKNTAVIFIFIGMVFGITLCFRNVHTDTAVENIKQKLEQRQVNNISFHIPSMFCATKSIKIEYVRDQYNTLRQELLNYLQELNTHSNNTAVNI